MDSPLSEQDVFQHISSIEPGTRLKSSEVELLLSRMQNKWVSYYRSSNMRPKCTYFNRTSRTNHGELLHHILDVGLFNIDLIDLFLEHGLLSDICYARYLSPDTLEYILRNNLKAFHNHSQIALCNNCEHHFTLNQELVNVLMKYAKPQVGLGYLFFKLYLQRAKDMPCEKIIRYFLTDNSQPIDSSAFRFVVEKPFDPILLVEVYKHAPDIFFHDFEPELFFEHDSYFSAMLKNGLDHELGLFLECGIVQRVNYDKANFGPVFEEWDYPELGEKKTTRDRILKQYLTDNIGLPDTVENIALALSIRGNTKFVTEYIKYKPKICTMKGLYRFISTTPMSSLDTDTLSAVLDLIRYNKNEYHKVMSRTLTRCSYYKDTFASRTNYNQIFYHIVESGLYSEDIFHLFYCLDGVDKTMLVRDTCYSRHLTTETLEFMLTYHKQEFDTYKLWSYSTQYGGCRSCKHVQLDHDMIRVLMNNHRMINRGMSQLYLNQYLQKAKTLATSENVAYFLRIHNYSSDTSFHFLTTKAGINPELFAIVYKMIPKVFHSRRRNGRSAFDEMVRLGLHEELLLLFETRALKKLNLLPEYASMWNVQETMIKVNTKRMSILQEHLIPDLTGEVMRALGYTVSH